MSVALTSFRYAPLTVSPCVAATMKIAEKAAWKTIANQGVFHFGCVFAKIGGRYRSRPPTKSRRAVAISQAPTPPRPASVIRSAIGAPSQGSPCARPALVMAWLTPEMIEISLFGSAHRSEIVPSR